MTDPFGDGGGSDSVDEGAIGDPADERVLGGPFDERGVSDLIGFILVFSLIVSVVAIVSVSGLDALQDTREAEQSKNAERAMEVLADNMADIYERGAPSRATEISLSDSQLYADDSVEIRIRNTNPALDETFEVRPLVHRSADGTELVYVMGAVFRVDANGGGVVLRDWDPVLDESRTVFPIVNTTATNNTATNIKASTVLVRANEQGRNVTVADRDGSYDDLTITVTSPRADLWVAMLGTNPAFNCHKPASDTAECSLDYTPTRFFLVETQVDLALKQ